jgi:hypothetical protein
VKVMDTLDKKMQTILEREDLSADEHLKLYDQSFTRYLNVYDDYRPRRPRYKTYDIIYGSIIGISLWGFSHNKLKNSGRFFPGRFDLGRNVSYRIYIHNIYIFLTHLPPLW